MHHRDTGTRPLQRRGSEPKKIRYLAYITIGGVFHRHYYVLSAIEYSSGILCKPFILSNSSGIRVDRRKAYKEVVQNVFVR